MVAIAPSAVLRVEDTPLPSSFLFKRICREDKRTPYTFWDRPSFHVTSLPLYTVAETMYYVCVFFR